MRPNPLLAVRRCGQSVWLDFVRRRWLEDGTLAELVRRDHICGLIANPAVPVPPMIPQGDYDVPIAGLAARGFAPGQICERLTRNDVELAAALLHGVYHDTAGEDGYACLCVPPRLAYDAEGTLAQARRLRASVRRPNVMIAVPATREALPAIRTLLAEGISVDATLLFGRERHREVVDVWLAALEERAAAGLSLASVASVASFVLWRIDAAADAQLDAIARREAQAQALRGRAAIACARGAYAHLQRVLASPRWRALAARGARPQRLLWAVAAPAGAAGADLKYVDALIGPQTIAALAPSTLDAYRDHGRPARRIGGGRRAAADLPRALARLGIDLEAAASALQREVVRESVATFDALQGRVAHCAAASLRGAASAASAFRRATPKRATAGDR